MQQELIYPTDFNAEVQASTSELYKSVSKIIPEVEWPFHAPLIHEINILKKESKFLYKQGFLMLDVL